MRFDHTVATVAMPGDVWAVWTDVDRWPEWDTELESASVEGVHGPLSFLFGALLGRRFRAALPGVMENVRRIAESRYRARGSSPDQVKSTKGDEHDEQS